MVPASVKNRQTSRRALAFQASCAEHETKGERLRNSILPNHPAIGTCWLLTPRLLGNVRLATLLHQRGLDTSADYPSDADVTFVLWLLVFVSMQSPCTVPYRTDTIPYTVI